MTEKCSFEVFFYLDLFAIIHCIFKALLFLIAFIMSPFSCDTPLYCLCIVLFQQIMDLIITIQASRFTWLKLIKYLI